MAGYSVTCYTCLVNVYDSDTPPTDAQALLTTYANATCPRTDCPHKTAAVEAEKSKRPVTRAELLDIERRLKAVETKVGI